MPEMSIKETKNTEKIVSVMKQYHVFKKKVDKMNNKTLQKALIIIDNAEGVSHDDFFEIAAYMFVIDKLDIQIEED
jgi:prophage maintenance system killer protein